MTAVIVMAVGSALSVVSSNTASTATYKTGGVHFKAAFPSTVMTATATKEDLTKMQGANVVSSTAFAVGVDPSDLLAGLIHVPKPNAFVVEVFTFSSTSAAKSYFAGFQGASGAKEETLDGRTAYGVIGNSAALNSGTFVPDKNATQGNLAVREGKSILVAITQTKMAATTMSFLKSLKILS
jgi:hypothetical protein